MASPDASLAAIAAEVDGAEDDGTRAGDGDVMLDWKKADGQLASMGLLYVVLSLILLSGRSVADGEFPEARSENV